MRKGYARKAVWDDVKPISATMRDADVAEVKAAANSSPEGALYEGLLTSAFGGRTYTVCLANHTPVAMLGVSPSGQPGLGVVWLMASDQLMDIQTLFIRESKNYLAEITKGYRAVYNFTDARNSVHHRWLQWTGFTIIKRHEKWGHEGRPFLEFCKITEERYV